MGATQKDEPPLLQGPLRPARKGARQSNNDEQNEEKFLPNALKKISRAASGFQSARFTGVSDRC
jgi:hypothetical protein